MLGLDVIEVMTPSGHPSIINKKMVFSQCRIVIFEIFFPTNLGNHTN